MAKASRIGVTGAGAWGTALANVCARNGHTVAIHDVDASVLAEIRAKRTNSKLPGVPIERGVEVGDLAAIGKAEIVLLVTPAQHARSACAALGPHLSPGTPVVACAKGIERGTGKFMTEIVAEEMASTCPAILSGPSFAADVARGLPTAVTLAAADESIAASLAATLRSPAFRVYHSVDVRGVEIGGAAKNVLAIAAGIVVGRKLGASALAALTARGFAELVRFGRAHGANPETLMGLSGLGDLILTSTSPQSRNYSLGVSLGGGAPLSAAAAPGLAEGALTAAALVEMARAQGIEMPIAEAVDDVLAGRLDVEGAIARLLSRPMGAEA